MITVVVVTHGNLAKAVLDTAETILGKQDNVVTLKLSKEDRMDMLKDSIKEIVKVTDPQDGIICFVDMMGGTPCNACLTLCKDLNIEVVSGVNLYMMLSALINRKNMDVKTLVNKVIEDGKKSIADAKKMFLQRL